MTNNKQQTTVDWIEQEMLKPNLSMKEILEQAKEKEKEQRGYTKEDVLKAGEMGEINHHDTKHIVSYLDEARDFNETYGGTE
jgi:hypothetical protein